MRNLYYLLFSLITYFTFPVAFGQAGCSGLEITATEEGSVCGGGTISLKATGSGSGDDIIWYASATDTIPIGFGEVFRTNKLSTTTSYWASEGKYDASSSGISLLPELLYFKFNSASSITNDAAQPVGTSSLSITGNGLSIGGAGMTGTALQGTGTSGSLIDTGWGVELDDSFTIGFWTDDVPQTTTLYYIFGDGGATDFRCFTNGVAGAGNWMIRGGGLPDLTFTGGADGTAHYMHAVYDASAGTFTAYLDGVQVDQKTVTGTPDSKGTSLTIGGYSGSGLSGLLDEFRWYNRALSTTEVQTSYNVDVDVALLCESNRKEVVATVNSSGDEDVTALPYTHTANTATYHNNYSGVPGDDCGASDAYLYGNDVVYKYTADDDYILKVELTDVSEKNTAVFVYEDCADIGDVCAAEGSINESVSNHYFQMLVEDGKDYYFVVSSSEPTDSFDYTLKINGSTCNDYPLPIGDATQSFVDGQALSDLKVDGSDLTWYSDAALTNELSDDMVLVDNTTYYVTQTFDTCESNALAIIVKEEPCSVLKVVNTQDNEVCGIGSVTLTAEASENIVNTNIYWYDSANGGERVGNGKDWITPELTQTTSFWATEVALSGGGEVTGQGKLTHNTPNPSGYTLAAGVEFTAIKGFTLTNVEAYSISTAGGVIPSIQLQDGSGQMIEEVTNVTVPSGATGVNAVPFTIELNFEVPGAGTYRLMTVGSHASLVRDSGTTNSAYPYLLGDVGEITTGILTSSSSSSYYYFYNWTIGSEDVLCESDRVEVIATVNDVADEIVSEPLPFTHSSNTRDYGNNYFGEAGRQCDSGEYLNGNDVVYQFSPSIGGVYSIELSNLSSTNAGVFIYESCYDIGTSCTAGAVSNGDTSDFGIAEVALNDGQDYFIVISTETSSSTAYTITIDEAQIDCADYTDAPEGEEHQYVQAGFTLSDLEVKGANLKYYTSSSLNSNDELPSSTNTVDGSTYYITQTLNGCESNYLEVTVEEVDCNDLKIIQANDITLVCTGYPTLEAEGAEAFSNTEVYWFSSETGDEIVHRGSTFKIDDAINQDTSFWVAEVMLGGQVFVPGQGKEEHSRGTSYASTLDYGLQFDVEEEFTLYSVDVYPDGSGNLEISLFDSGGNLINSVQQNVSSSLTTPVTVILDFDIPVGTGYRLLQTSNPSIALIRDSSGNSFPYDLGLNGEYGAITNGTYGTSTSNSASYYYFYNWVLGEDGIICESPREEVKITISQDGDEIVGSLPYTHSENTATYGNSYQGTPGDNCGISENYLNGNDVVYMYEATADDLITIELTDLDGYYAGIFVYESCADFGDSCAAGAVAGPTTDDLIIQDFPVEDGETYYIVISSWLTSSVDYTLNIKSFSCSELEAPVGDSSQDFVAGDMVSDLNAEETRLNAVLTWYSDAGLTQEITDPSTEALVDGAIYYVTQTTNNCESPALAITADEIDCSDLEIVDVIDAEVACRGEMTLEAISSGTGTEVYWYDSATDGELIGRGNTFTTPEISQTTSYWAAEAYLDGLVYETEQAASNPSALLNSANTNSGLQFEVFERFTLESVEVLGTGTGGDIQIDIRDIDDNNNIIFTTIVTIPAGGTASAPIPVEIPIGVDLPEGNYRILRVTSGTTVGLGYMSAANSSFPYTLGNNLGEVTTGSSLSGTSTLYYFFYDWTISTGELICESPRKEVVATVEQSGDIQLDYTELPYTDSNNTSLFGNNFSGDAGDGCEGEKYLNGYEALYYYEADPNNDDILRIEVLNASNPSTAVFVYSSCGDIGIDCLDGAVAENKEAIIEDFFIEAGEQIFIVVSSSAGTTDYTLNIEGLDCNNVDAPQGDTAPLFVQGYTIDDLEVDGSPYNEGFTWYRDAALTDEITDSSLENLIDGNSYFVTQTLLGCEGDALEIIPIEFHCSDMEVDILETDVYVCSPGGEITIEVLSSGFGSEVFWYDDVSGGNYLGKGNSFTIDVENDMELWATEVFLEGEASLMGQGKPAATSVSTFGSTLNYGLEFDVVEDFTLQSVDIYPNAAGQVEISLFDSSGNLLNVKQENVSASLNQPVTVILDFEIPQGTGYRLLQTSTPSLALVRDTVDNNFPYALGANGELGTITNGTYGTSTSNTTTYYYFYNWVIGQQEVLCESTRTKVNVILNDDIPAAPIVTPMQKICGDGLLSELIVLGINIKWYNSNGSEVSANSLILEGETYYVTQTILGCESAMKEVIMDFNELSEFPVATINQSYETGETLSDLDVIGSDLTWYSDPFKSTELDSSTVLVDQTTYYVAQTESDKCESEALGITVHQVLDIGDVLFEHFEYYPNPVEDILFITNSHVIEKVEIYELSGRRIFSHDYKSASLEVEVSQFSTGTYILKATVDSTERIFRIIKK